MHGDSELVIKQVNGEYATKHPRLRAYRDDTMDLWKTFVEYELVFVPRSQNVIANGLACLDSSYPKTPSDQQIIIQTKFRPAVPNNEKYWQAFEGDKHIEDYLVGRNEFEFSDSESKSDSFYPDGDPPDEQETPCNIEINSFSEQTRNPTENCENADTEEIEVLQAKDKNIPRGLAPLEDLFDFDDVAKKPTIEHADSDVEVCNIGTEDRPRMIKLAKSIPANMKNKYIDLFKEFIDVFAWNYEDLNAYDTNIIQHKIP